MHPSLARLLEEEQERADMRSLLERIEQQQDKIIRLLSERDADELGGIAELATWIGSPSTAACKALLSRPTGADLANLCVRVGGRRRWRKQSVLAWLAERGGRRGKGAE